MLRSLLRRRKIKMVDRRRLRSAFSMSVYGVILRRLRRLMARLLEWLLRPLRVDLLLILVRVGLRWCCRRIRVAPGTRNCLRVRILR